MAETILQANPYNRPPREQPVFQPVDIEIPPPPGRQEEQARSVLLTLLPMSSFLMMGVFYGLIYAISGRGAGGSSLLFTLPMVLMGLFMVGISLVVYGEQKHQQKLRQVRQLRDYHRQLDKKESRLLAAETLQKWTLNERFPAPDALEAQVQRLETSLWERRPDDVDFLSLRLGTGAVRSIVSIRPPDPDAEVGDASLRPVLRRAFGLYTHYRDLPLAPVAVSLRDTGTLGLVGPRNDRLGLAFWLVAQLTALHAPQDVQVYLFSAQQYYQRWQWLRWLPHVSSAMTAGRPAYMAFTVKASQELVSNLSRRLDERAEPKEGTVPEMMPHIVVVLDGDSGVREEPVFARLLNEGARLNASAIILGETLESLPSDCRGVVELVSRGRFRYWTTGAEAVKLSGEPETLGLGVVDNLAHRLVGVGVQVANQSGQIPAQVNLLQTYQVQTLAELLIERHWQRLPEKDGLLPFPVPLGNVREMSPLVLHLAENRDGPHGIVAGTTGSGKSELLQTLVTAMAIEHHPYFLNFLLIDFKGASAFGAFRGLPHTVGMISNLDRASALRALEAIKAENLRRQQFLQDRGVEDILEYHEELAEKGLSAGWEPLPHLFIIIDEFAQLAKEMPDFMPELMGLLRVGRSLGLHLVLATQRPAGVVNDEMRSNLNFRICLRVQTIDDSRDMLRRPDAALLPHTLPGRAYFQVGDSGMPRQFQTARVGVEYAETSDRDAEIIDDPIYEVDLEELNLLYQPEKPARKKPEAGQKKLKIHEKLVEEMRGLYEALALAHNLRRPDPILLDPLPAELPLRELFERRPAAAGAEDEPRERWRKLGPGGWNGTGWEDHPAGRGLRVEVGRLDDLARRQQPPLYVDFQGKHGGHLLVLGASQSGKTMFLRTLVHGLAYQYAPDQVHVYILSFAGRSLEPLKGFPQVGDVIFGNEMERIQRLIRYLSNTLEQRKVLLGNLGVDNLADYNARCLSARCLSARCPDQALPAIVVMIDNFGELRDSFYLNELEEITRLIENGRSFGIYFVMTILQLDAVPYKIMNLIEQRAALNLTEKTDYLTFVGRPYSLEFGALPPGRGLWAGAPPLHFQAAFIAEPVEDADDASPDRPKEAGWSSGLMSSMQANWGDRAGGPAQIKILPTRVNLSALVPRRAKGELPGAGRRLPVGLNFDTLEPFTLQWGEDCWHLLAGGPSQSGRTSLLHTLALSVIARYSPAEAWIVLVDGTQGSLRRLAAYPHVLAWISNEEDLATNIAFLEEELKYRREVAGQPEADHFPEIFFIIDDYDLTTEAISIPKTFLSMIGKTIRRDSNLGFHFLLSNIAQNLGRDSDPLIRQLKLLRSGISLGNVEALEALGGRATTAMRRQELPEGRGYFLNSKQTRLVQFAYPDDETYDWLAEFYAGVPRVGWQREPSAEVVQNIEQVAQQPAADASWSGEWLDDMDDYVQTYIEKRKQEIAGGGQPPRQE